MKFKISVLVVVTMFITSNCTNENNSPSNNNSDTLTSKTPDQTPQRPDSINCYLFVSGRDSYMLRLNNELIGKMEFRNYQKDKSFGTVKGERNNGLIRLWYNFTSEGMNSVSEMYFKPSGDDLIRGLSTEPKVSNDTAYYGKFKETDLQNGQTFKKVECSTFRFRDE